MSTTSETGRRSTNIDLIDRTAVNSEPSVLRLRLLTPSNCLGAIIGHHGENVNETSAKTGTKIDILRDDPVAANYETLIELGSRSADSMCMAVKMILQDIYDKIFSKWQRRLSKSNELSEEGTVSDESIRLRIVNFYLKFLVSNDLVGQIIGKEGRNIAELRDKTDTHISISSMFELKGCTMERTLTIKQAENDIDKIVEAFRIVFEKIQLIKMRTLDHIDEVEVNESRPNETFNQSAEFALMQAVNSLRLTEEAPTNGDNGALLIASWLSQLQTQNGLLGSLMQQPNPFMPYYQPYTLDYPPRYSQYPTPNQQPIRCSRSSRNESVTLYIPYFAAGVIIGHRGSAIRHIIKSTGATIKISPDKRDSTTESEDDEMAQKRNFILASSSRQVLIKGKSDAQYRAQFTIFHMLSNCGFVGHHYDKLLEVVGDSASDSMLGSVLKPNEKDIVLVAELCVPYEVVGRIIGKRGARIRSIERSTNSLIRFSVDANKKVIQLHQHEMSEQSIPEQMNKNKECPQPRPDDETTFAIIYIIGNFTSCYSAQKHIRQIVECYEQTQFYPKTTDDGNESEGKIVNGQP